MSHTKGPWTWNSDGYGFTSLEPNVLCGYQSEYVSVNWGNASLIEAAPDLLEAVEERITLVEKMRAAKATIHSDFFGQSLHENEQKMRAAIAKAKGLKP